ncbi:MAG: type II toxin-antitoxin system RelE/ParE family toxin [Xanthobacteraceae bacterium]|nr:type II toxin-antitoxin system RelE/ParE family toxin [Xanthobacteraceae bacterium]
MKAVVFTSAAGRQWIELTASIRGRIMPKLQTCASAATGDVKRLKGQAGCRRRVGDYRVIFFEDAKTITIVAVGHRRDIYD